jgi:diaminopimelate decarboxylase
MTIKKDRLIQPDFAFQYRKNEFSVEGIPLSDLVDRYGSPLYVYSGKAIRESYTRLKKSLKGMPVQICYAVKANSNLSILKFLRDLGAGCDLVSHGEWKRAELAGIPRDLRVLSGVAKTAAELDELLQLPNAGVGSIHVESVMEFELIQLLANYRKRPVTVAFRYNPDVDAKTHDKISTGRRKDKFGLTREEILDLCVNFAQDDFVRIAGISIHIGSQITSLKPYEQAFKILSRLCDEVEEHLGRALDYVDLGGGIGVPYRPGEESLSLDEFGALVRKYFYSDSGARGSSGASNANSSSKAGYGVAGIYGKNARGANGRKMKKILLEPGRSLMANAGVLVSDVVYSKVRGNHRTLILDAGMNDLMRPALYDAYHGIVAVHQSREIKMAKWDVVGGICETSDYFARERPLAVEGLPGERVAILSAGAYGFSMSNSYNTRPQVAEVLVDQGKVKLIRKRQTFQDLVGLE